MGFNSGFKGLNLLNMKVNLALCTATKYVTFHVVNLIKRIILLFILILGSTNTQLWAQFYGFISSVAVTVKFNVQIFKTWGP